MTTAGGPPVAAVDHDLERRYALATGEISFRDLLSAIDPASDAALADLIEADGRQRISCGRHTGLERYLDAVPDLFQRQDPLDAAIDVTLRCMSGSSRAFSEAMAELIQQYPQLESIIRESAALNGAMCSTTGLRARIGHGPAKLLPCDFGPLLANGQSRYQLQRLLGRGGFGHVYLALDRHLSEDDHTALVAIKILASADRSPWARERLIEEATKARRISHPNVVMVMDRGISDDNEDFIVYEYVDGGDLSMTASLPMPLRQVAAMVARIARGIHAAHSAGVIHCDLKPGNIMLTSSGEPKVADFGIAVRLSQRSGAARISGPESHHPGTADPSPLAGPAVDDARGPVGNVAFISPEQYRGEDHGFSVQSDIYAIGGILFLLLTGQLPNGRTLQEIARTHDAIHGRSQAPGLRLHRRAIDGDLEAICRRAMAPQPAARYESAAAMAEDLERWLRREPIAWTRPSKLRVLGLWARRKPALAAAVAVIVLLVISGSATALHLLSVANHNATEARINLIKAEQEERARLQIEEMRKRSETLAQRVADLLRPKVADYRFSTEALAYIWVLEYVFGPAVFGMPDQQQALWDHRIGHIRSLVQQAHANGRGNHLETLLWETALAFWLVNAKDHEEVQPLLDNLNQRLRTMLAPDDHWLEQLRVIGLCAEVNHLRATIGDSVSPDEAATLRETEQSLLAWCAGLGPDRSGTPMHFLALGSLADLYSPTLLNRPAEHQRVQEMRASLLKRDVRRQ